MSPLRRQLHHQHQHRHNHYNQHRQEHHYHHHHHHPTNQNVQRHAIFHLILLTATVIAVTGVSSVTAAAAAAAAAKSSTVTHPTTSSASALSPTTPTPSTAAAPCESTVLPHVPPAPVRLSNVSSVVPIELTHVNQCSFILLNAIISSPIQKLHPYHRCPVLRCLHADRDGCPSVGRISQRSQSGDNRQHQQRHIQTTCQQYRQRSITRRREFARFRACRTRSQVGRRRFSWCHCNGAAITATATASVWWRPEPGSCNGNC